MILGLDISTSITGATILDKDNQIVYNTAWDTRKYKNIFEKATYVKEQILDLYNKHGLDHHSHTSDTIEHIFIEQPFTFFNSGGSSAKTMAALQKFNGIVSWMVYELFEIKPQYVGATQARKLCGIKVPRGQKAKKVVLQHLLDTEKAFSVEYTRFGNPKPESFDRADAIIVARAGHKIIQDLLDSEE